MKVGIYGQSNNEITIKHVNHLVELCLANDIIPVFEDSFYQGYVEFHGAMEFKTFSSYENIDRDLSFFFTVGGDGTFLRSITFIRDLNIPIIGINTGRLGFLATVQKENIEVAFKNLLSNQFLIVNRTLLSARTTGCTDGFSDVSFALNEVTITRKNTASMIKINAKLDNEFLTTYWSDGLIISTPTGSTGYSLSCGGPIISPNSKNIVLTPIAPHSLAVRPLVIPEQTDIKLDIDSRADEILLTLDSRMYSLRNNSTVYIKMCPFSIKTIQLKDQTFIKTLREKLLWGEDKRN